MKGIFYLIFLISWHSNAQELNLSRRFEYYKNGNFENVDRLTFKVANNSDTISCEIIGGKLILPKLSSTYSIIVTDGEKRFIIEDVDFTKVEGNLDIIFGVEKNFKNLNLIESAAGTFYSLKNRLAFVQLENLNDAKEDCFIIFQSPTGDEQMKKTSKSYSRFAITKRK